MACIYILIRIRTCTRCKSVCLVAGIWKSNNCESGFLLQNVEKKFNAELDRHLEKFVDVAIHLVNKGDCVIPIGILESGLLLHCSHLY